MKNTFFASKNLLQVFANANACSAIPEGKNCSVFDFRNKKIVIIGSSSSGAFGVHWVSAYECVPFDFSKKIGKSYNEHFKAVLEKKEERGYKNIIIKSKGEKWVIIGDQFYIEPVQMEEQLSFSF